VLFARLVVVVVVVVVASSSLFVVAVVVVVVFGGGFVVAFWNQGVKVVWCKAVWRKRLSGWFWFNSWISTSSVNMKCLPMPFHIACHIAAQGLPCEMDIRSYDSFVVLCSAGVLAGLDISQVSAVTTKMNQKRCL